MKNIALIGLPGSGKTTLGMEFAKRHGRKFIDLDTLIEKRQGQSIADIFGRLGESSFRKMETEAVKLAVKEETAVISCGGGIILKEENMDMLNNSIIVFINRPVDHIVKSIDVNNRPLLAGDPAKIIKLYNERLPLYEKYSDFEIGKDKDFDETLNELENIAAMETANKKLAVIGSPITHSLSPDIHIPVLGRFYKTVSYSRVEVEKNELIEWLDTGISDGIDGFNVTMPHKISIIPLLDKIDEEAAFLNSVNTVIEKSGKLWGYNTDGAGFTAALEKEGETFNGKKIAIIGAGGAGSTIAMKAASDGAEKIIIIGRTAVKAETLSKRVREFYGVNCVCYCSSDRELSNELRDNDIMINATPLGMTGIDDDFEDFVFLDLLKNEALVCDLVYSPVKTNLLFEAEKRGFRTLGGLPMLIYQGLIADKLFMQAELNIQKAYDRAFSSIKGKVEKSTESTERVELK